ncbi:MAG: hypothetical protein IJ736_15110 [Firmicutes bacterium]|nr:hypothetical protein [Bacillota bacterium]
MNGKGICYRCGEDSFLRTWGEWSGLCLKCVREVRQEKVKKEFDDFYANAEEGETFDTWSDEFVICPHCGYADPTEWGFEDFPEIYEDGEHEVECPECEKKFVLETHISYFYKTKKLSRE